LSNRLTKLLIVWFSLFSVAIPAITCAAATHHGDCCPDEGKPPCGECPDKTPARSASPDHCLAAPSSVATSGAISEPTRKLAMPDIEPVAMVTIPAGPASLGDSADPIRHRWRPPPDIFENPTYLVTGRLRL
jgi:hypothetical protein